jgi:hypothetical protein
MPSGTVKWFNVTKGSRCHVEAVRAMSALLRPTVWPHLKPLELRMIQIQRLGPLPGHVRPERPLIFSTLQTQPGFPRRCEKHKGCGAQLRDR